MSNGLLRLKVLVFCKTFIKLIRILKITLSESIMESMFLLKIEFLLFYKEEQIFIKHFIHRMRFSCAYASFLSFWFSFAILCSLVIS